MFLLLVAGTALLAGWCADCGKYVKLDKPPGN